MLCVSKKFCTWNRYLWMSNCITLWVLITHPYPRFWWQTSHMVYQNILTHWDRVTHICVSDLTIIGSDNGLSPGRRQAVIRTNAGILIIRPLGTNFSEVLIEILIFSFKKMRLKVSSAKRRTFCLDLNVLRKIIYKTQMDTNGYSVYICIHLRFI